MFYKAEVQYVKLIHEAFDKFSRYTGLQEVEYTQGVVYCEGSLPFKYFGSPTVPKKNSLLSMYATC